MEKIHLVKNSLHYYQEMHCGIEFSWWDVPIEEFKGIYMDPPSKFWYTEDLESCTCLDCIQSEVVK